MAFFKPKPNLPVDEKARIEFHLHQIGEAIGFDRMTLPVLSTDKLLELIPDQRTPKHIINLVGKHLSHDVSELRFEVVPEKIEKCGSGG